MKKQWDVDKTLIERVQGWERWQGSHYELSMVYPSLSQQERLHLLQYAWNEANVLGVIEQPDQFGQAWHELATIDTADARHSYGYIRLVDGHVIGCGSYFSSRSDTTWFSLYIPMGQLDQIFPVSYPLIGGENHQWMSIVDASLALLGADVYCEMAFKVAALGEEVSGFSIQRVLPLLDSHASLLVPEALFEQYNIAPRGKNIGAGLWWTGGAIKEDF